MPKTRKIMRTQFDKSDEFQLIISGSSLGLSAIALAIYDIACIWNGTINLNRHFPFVQSLGQAGISVIIFIILHHGRKHSLACAHLGVFLYKRKNKKDLKYTKNNEKYQIKYEINKNRKSNH